MEIDRRAFIAKLGGAAAVAAMAHEDRAEAMEHEMNDLLELQQNAGQPAPQRLPRSEDLRRGTGRVFDARRELVALPEKPTLMDFFEARFSTGHGMRSAHRAIETGQPERTVFACLVHDATQSLCRSDHGWWGGQLFEPYVDERISWGIRYHQALRFYPDESVGYEYPEMYNRIFGVDYVPEPYLENAYLHARKHKWYMEARLITANDEYGFLADVEVHLENFTDIIGRNFKNPKEGLGNDNSPSSHMWRTIINPDRPL